ncbi:MAG TPA: hypothetical protein VGX72_03595 [Solirubrobacteraceae bacterium]|nr:hypothetical protein [Solirubrobacteraceae bacterium]
MALVSDIAARRKLLAEMNREGTPLGVRGPHSPLIKQLDAHLIKQGEPDPLAPMRENYHLSVKIYGLAKSVGLGSCVAAPRQPIGG